MRAWLIPESRRCRKWLPIRPTLPVISCFSDPESRNPSRTRADDVVADKLYQTRPGGAVPKAHTATRRARAIAECDDGTRCINRRDGADRTDDRAVRHHGSHTARILDGSRHW